MLVVTIVLLASAGSIADSRPCVPAKPGEKFRVDFKDVSLRKITRLISCALEWNIVFQPSRIADRKVTVMAPKAVSTRDLRHLFKALLRSEKLKMRRMGRYRVITPR